MDVWLLEVRFKDIDRPEYLCTDAAVFSTRERALAWVYAQGERVRWRYSKDNPDWQKGATTEGQVRTHYTLWRTVVDSALDEDAA